jgi:type III pantothenate kinase
MAVTTICFDFGNTRVKYAVFVQGQLASVHTLAEPSLALIQQAVAEHRAERSFLSSVIHHPIEIEEWLQQHTQFHKLSHETILPFTTPVAKPATIGADRLALVAAAVHQFPASHSLVIALGTCITYNYVNVFNQFVGGSISPGMHMRFLAMHQQTALLPLVEAAPNVPLMGFDTLTNLQSGVVWGMAAEIDGIIDQYAKNLSNFNVLLTGGDLGYFVPRLKNKIFADQNLLFKGLYAICEKNF